VAAAASRQCPSADPGALSPELALVDPELAQWGRALLTAFSETSSDAPARSSKDVDLGARLRLMQAAVADEVYAALVPPPRAARRRIALVPTLAAWNGVILFVVQLQLNAGHLG
jgi:hypothetical protein